MSKSTVLRLADLSAIHALVQECRELGDDHSRWHEHWLRSIAGLLGADLAVGGESTQQPDGRVCAVNTDVWGWENGFDRAAFARILADEAAEITTSPIIAKYFLRPDGADGAGVIRSDIIPDGEWYPSPYYERIQLTLGIDHSLVSFRALPGKAGENNGICLTRGTDVRRDFDHRDRLRLQQAHAVIVPLLRGPLARFDEPSPAKLPPRVRQVLTCLLEGDSDKQAAVRLRISPYTVNQYVKTIFTHFGVTTRAELLARWIKRGWGRGGW